MAAASTQQEKMRTAKAQLIFFFICHIVVPKIIESQILRPAVFEGTGQTDTFIK